MRKTWKKSIAMACALVVATTSVDFSSITANAAATTSMTVKQYNEIAVTESMVSTNSENTPGTYPNDGYASWAFDDENHWWHSRYEGMNNVTPEEHQTGKPTSENPVWIQVDFGEEKKIEKITYTPRGGGAFKDFDILVDDENGDLKVEKSVTLTSSAVTENEIKLDNPVTTTKVRISVKSTLDSSYCAAKRIKIYEVSETEGTEGYIDDSVMGGNAVSNSYMTSGDDGPASYAFNDNSNQIWHGRYDNYGNGEHGVSGIPSDSNGVYMITGFDKSTYVSGFYYESRRADVGQITNYKISVANLDNPNADFKDPTNTAAEGLSVGDVTWKDIYVQKNQSINTGEVQKLDITFEKPILATHIKLEIFGTTGNYVQVKRIKVKETLPLTALQKRITLVESWGTELPDDLKNALNDAKEVSNNAANISDADVNTQIAAFDAVIDAVPAKSITLNQENLELKYNLESIGKASLTATVLPDYAANKNVVWSSDREEIATVDQNGNVTATGVGNAVITVTSETDATIKATCNVTVTALEGKNVALNKTATIENSSNPRWVEQAVDGVYSNASSHADWPKETNAYLQIDLGALCELNALHLYRYWADSRTYADTVIAVAPKTDDFASGDAKVVYNSCTTDVFGFGTGSDAQYAETSDGKAIYFDESVNARYVRVYMNGSTENAHNHIVELKAIGNELAGFTTGSISLNGNIGVNFKADISEDLLDGSYVQFTANNKTSEKIMAADNTYNGGYRFSYDVCAAGMTETITAQMFLKDGTEISKRTLSVQDYARTVLNSTDEAFTAVKPLVKSMINYGSYAQTQFNNTNEKANTIFDEATSSAMTEAMNGVSADVVNEATSAYTQNNGISAFTKISTSLILESETSLRHYFTVEEGKTLEDFASYTFKVGEKTLTPQMKENDNRIYVQIDNISAKDLDKSYTLTVTDPNGNTATVTCSALNYANAVLTNDSSDENIKNLVKALYLYNKEAKTYFAN